MASVNFDILARDMGSRAFNNFAGSVDRSRASIDRTNRASAVASRSFRSMGRVAANAAKGLAVAGGAAAVGATAGFRSAISAASDLGETTSKVSQIFGKAAVPALEKFAAGAAKSLGQSRQSALDAAATFATFGKSAGLSGQNLVGFSTQLTSLSSDLASFHNTSPEEAITAIGAALRGENEPIRRYGVLLDDASLRQEALRQGLISTTKTALTPQQKVLAAQALIMKQTSDAQGDFARTSGGLANQQRILSASVENVKAKIGQALLPAVTAAMKGFSGFVSQMQSGEGTGGRFAAILTRVGEVTQHAFAVFKADLLPTLQSLWAWVTGRLAPALRGYYAEIMPRLRAAFQSIAATIRDNQGVFRSLGQLLTDVIIPIIARAASLLINTLGPAFKVVVGVVKNVVIPAFSLLVGSVLTALNGIVSGAAIAFGWIPGIGPKLQTAADEFDTFVDDINAKLGRIIKDVNVNVNIHPVIKPISDEVHAKGFIGPTIAEAKSAKGIAGPYSPRDRGEPQARAAAKKLAAFHARQAAAAAKSAIPKFQTTGGALGGAMAKGIDKSRTKAATAAGNVAKAALDAAKQKLADARRELADYARGIRDAIMDFGGLGNFDQDRGVTANSINAFLNRQLEAIRRFQENLRTLTRKGVAKSLIRQITEMGPEQGGRFAAALAAGSRSQINVANTRTAQIASIGTQVGNTQARLQLGGDVARERQHQQRVEDKLDRLIAVQKRERHATLTVRGDQSTAKTIRSSTLALNF